MNFQCQHDIENIKQESSFDREISEVMATYSFLSEPTSSAPTSCTSSRRSSEVSFAGSSSSFSCFDPTSPGSTSTHTLLDELAPNSDETHAFLANLSLCESLHAQANILEQWDTLGSPAAISYDQIAFNGDIPPHETLSGSMLYRDQYTEDVIPYSSVAIMQNETADATYFCPAPPPPLVIPSQMVIPLSDSISDSSPSGLPEEAREEVVDEYFQNDGTFVGVRYRPSSTSYHRSKQRNKSNQKTSARSKVSSGGRYLGRSAGSGGTSVRALKPACTRATATKSKKHPCDLCSTGFDRLEHFKRHQISKSHRDMEKELRRTLEPVPVYPCRACPKTFNRRDNLKPHIKTHFVKDGKLPRNDVITMEQSEKYGWQEFDPRFPSKEKSKAKEKKPKMAE